MGVHRVFGRRVVSLAPEILAMYVFEMEKLVRAAARTVGGGR